MKERIQKKLKEIEQQHSLQILLAVESGSRAWGFASEDSDYDVRFLYRKERDDYLKLEKRRDTLEFPIDGLLDISGWDLNKTLQLLHSSNPTLFEWFSSPIVYMKKAETVRIEEILPEYFSPRKSIHHYLSMAERNYRAYVDGRETVRAKKYFYVLRPLLAGRYILHTQKIPPIVLTELCREELPAQLQDTVGELLRIKKEVKEMKEIPALPELNAWLRAELQLLKEAAEELPEERSPGWEELDKVFREMLK